MNVAGFLADTKAVLIDTRAFMLYALLSTIFRVEKFNNLFHAFTWGQSAIFQLFAKIAATSVIYGSMKLQSWIMCNIICERIRMSSLLNARCAISILVIKRNVSRHLDFMHKDIWNESWLHPALVNLKIKINWTAYSWRAERRLDFQVQTLQKWPKQNFIYPFQFILE